MNKRFNSGGLCPEKREPRPMQSTGRRKGSAAPSGGETPLDSGKGVRIGQQPAPQRKKGAAAQAARRFSRKGGHRFAAVEAAFQQLRQTVQLGGQAGVLPTGQPGDPPQVGAVGFPPAAPAPSSRPWRSIAAQTPAGVLRRRTAQTQAESDAWWAENALRSMVSMRGGCG